MRPRPVTAVTDPIFDGKLHPSSSSETEEPDIFLSRNKNPITSKISHHPAEREMRKVKSMHELRKENLKTDFSDNEGDDRVKLADKIENFLATVNQQQEALTKMLEERRMGRASVVSRMSTVASNGLQTPMRKRSNNSTRSLRPQTAHPVVSTNSQTVPKNIRNKAERMRPVSLRKPPARQSLDRDWSKSSVSLLFDAAHVASKVKQDRNYQPPRRKRQQSLLSSTNPSFNQKKSLERQAATVRDDEYGDDFEADEEDENEIVAEEEDLIAKKKEAWLYDQAIRGRARQKAALELKNHQNHKQILGYQEKESSKDSAYGFSGGENSRLHTREPTPDTNNSQVQPRIVNPHTHGRFSRGPPPPVCQNPSLRKQFSASFGKITHPKISNATRQRPASAATFHMSKSRNHLVDVSDGQKVEFLHQVTKEILQRGHFTERAIKRALESQMTATRTPLSLSEKAELVRKLKERLGLLENHGDSQKPSMIRSKIIRGSTTSDSSSIESNKPSPPITVMSRESEKVVFQDDSLDDDLSSILKDESDLDVIQIIKSTLRSPSKNPQKEVFIHEELVDDPIDKKAVKKNEEENVPRKKLPVASHLNNDQLFDSLNLTNLNVSFTSANMHEAKRRLEESRTQALLVKSFAYDQDEHPQQSMANNHGHSHLNEEEEKEASEAEDDQDNHDESAALTPRSSQLYQSDSDHQDDVDDIDEEEDASAVSQSERKSESSSSSVEEDIPSA